MGIAIASDLTAEDASNEILFAKIKWRIIPLIVVCFLFSWFDRINIGFVKFDLQHSLALSDTAYGLGASLFVCGYVLLEVPSNMMLYRVGARRWIARILISWGVATAAMVFVRSETEFYVLRFIIGAAEAGFAPGIFYYLTTWFPPQQRGRVFGLLYQAVAFSGILGAPLSGLILGNFNGLGGLPAWNWVFLLGGVPCVFLGLLVLRRLDDSFEKAKWLSDPEKGRLRILLGEQSHAHGTRSLKEAIRIPGFLLLGFVFFLVQIASYGMNFWMPHLIRASGITDPTSIGFITAIPYLCGAVGMLIVGHVADRSGNRRAVFSACILISGIGFLATGFFDKSSVPLIFSLALIGFGMLSAIPTFWSLPPKLVSGAAAASGIALINSLGQLGGIVSPVMVGKISDIAGTTTPALYVIVAACVLCSSLAFFAFPERLRAPEQ